MKVILFILIVIVGSISQASVVTKIPNKMVLLSAQQYKQLPQLSKKDYIRSLRSAFLDINKQQRFKGKAIEYSHISVPVKNSEMFPINWLLGISEAFADDIPRCVVGGLIRKMVRANPSSKYLCPTYGRSCAGDSETFKCGLIFNEVCVARVPIEGLSERCANSADGNIPDSYSQFKQDYEDTLDQVCPPESESIGCTKAKVRIRSFNSEILQIVEKSSSDQTSEAVSTEASPQPTQTASAQVATFCQGRIDLNKMLTHMGCGKSLQDNADLNLKIKLSKILACGDCANINQNLKNIRVKKSGDNYVLDINSNRPSSTLTGISVNSTIDVSKLAEKIRCRSIGGAGQGGKSSVFRESEMTR